MSTFLDFVQIENDLAAPFSSSLLFRRHIMTTSDKNLQKKNTNTNKTEQEIFLPCHCEERRAALCTLPGCILERCSMSRCCKPGSDLKKKVLILFKENNAFCTLPDWPGVANLIITSLSVRDWFRTRKRQILGANLKQRTYSI